MSSFLDVVNRVLRINTVIGADDDNLTTFDDTQHVATLQIAKIAACSDFADSEDCYSIDPDRIIF